MNPINYTASTFTVYFVSWAETNGSRWWTKFISLIVVVTLSHASTRTGNHHVIIKMTVRRYA